MSEQNASRSWVWRLLRVLLPRWYRESYGEEMLRLHVQRAGRAGGAPFWLRVAGDVLLTAAQLRLDRWRSTATGKRSWPNVWDVSHQHVQLAVRGLLRSPGFTLAVLVTMVLGIGANTTIFAVLDRLLLSPPEHVVDAQSVRRLSIFGVSPFTRQSGYSSSLTFPDYRDLQSTRGFAALAGYSTTTMTLGRGAQSERVSAQFATASYFPLLGVRPLLGRFYTVEEDRIGNARPPAVVSHNFWRRHFAGERSVLGRTLDLGKGQYTVVGVAPRGFTGADLAPVDVWIPLQASQAIEAGTEWQNARGWYWFAALARLKPGVSEAAALAEATTYYRAGRAADSGKPQTATVAAHSLIAARGPNPAREVAVTKALAAVALLMLLVACANVSNLFVVRGIKRRRQLAVQSALGISRSRLMAQLLTEALLLATIAGALSFLVAQSAGPLLFRTLLPEATPPAAAGMRVLAATFLFTSAVILITGILHAVRTSRVDLMETLRAGKSAPRAVWLRQGLSALQAALSVILLVGAGLFLRSLQRARHIDVGLDLQTIAVSLELGSGERFGDELGPAAREALERVRAHPQVESAALTSIMPFYGVWGLKVALPAPDSLVTSMLGPFFYAAGSDYFRTLGIPILRGRALNDSDDALSAQPVAVVNQAMARALWKGADPLGKCFYIIGQRDTPEICTTVVGVARDVLPGITDTEPRQLYYVAPRHRTIGMNAGQMLLVRARGDARALAPAIRELVLSSVPGVRYVEAATLEERVAPQLRSWQLGATLLTVFGVLALLVAAAGLYSVLAFDVAQRRFELGVRSALGASAPRLVRVVTNHMLLVTTAGVLLGLLAALLLARAAQPLLFRVQATDPLVYAGAALTMVIVALAASVLPSWRATRIDPRIALTSE